jgi:coenzyme F420-0:L-glutamate ligase/coenzyme F420-1:gamma-L-glutamate ligase
LISAGVDRQGTDKAVVLPKNCDLIAKEIGEKLIGALQVQIAIVTTDSDGRVDKKGANQVAVGLYGIDGLRKTQYDDKTYVETLCDMLANSVGLVMGQRGVNIPVVKIRGLEYEFNESATIEDALN